MEFDNDISILLKKARELQIPSKFVVDGKNIITEIQSLIPTGKSLNELYEIFLTIQPEDLAMIYAITLPDTTQNLQDINVFYDSLRLPKIRDKAELNILVKEWQEKFSQIFEDDMLKLENIEILQEELAKYSSLDSSEIKVESTIIFAEMVFKDGKKPIVEDGYEIFDLSVPDKDVPYIRWNNTEKKLLTKLYTGKTLEERPDYSKAIQTSKEILNTIDFTVGKDNGYLKGVYSLETNLMKIKIPIESEKDKEVVLDKIVEVLPLKIEKLDEKSISGELFIFNIEVNDLLLSHMILNDELFKNYFFMKEMSAPLATKKQLKLFFRSISGLILEEDEQPSSVAFSISQNYAKGKESVNVLRDGKVETIVLDPKTPYIRINISSADSLKAAEDSIRIFSRLLSRYKDEEVNIKKLYLSYIPEFADYEEETEERKVGSRLPESKIGKLKQAMPDLFISDYARKCLLPKQPNIIPDSEVEEWKKKSFLHKGEKVKRQVMPFPPDNPKFNFVCPEDEYPFPGVKINKLGNKEEYPGLPCCFKKEQINSKTSKYALLYGEEQKTKKKTASLKKTERVIEKESPTRIKEAETHIIKSDKIINPGRYGTVPTSISDLLKNDVSIKEIRRKGVPRSTNSLLHAISIAINDNKYFKLDTDEKREKYVSGLREAIADKTYPELCKQEMYDFSNENISSTLKDNSLFLDPNLYYRAVEESYNINIFVFSPSEDEEKRLKNKEDSSGSIQFPRFKLFYSRAPRKDRATILIYRTLGSESDNLSYAQCELLVNYQGENEQAVFSENVYNIVFNASLEVNKTITWELVTENNVDLDIIARNNLYSRVNYFNLTKQLARKQYIDEYGKCRGLYLNDMLIVIPPSNPENIPESKEIVRTTYEKAVKFLGAPVAGSLDRDGKVDGLWFSVLDLVYGIYVPIISKEIKLPVGPINPLGEKGVDVSSRLIKIKRDLDFIMQILKWLLSLSRMNLEDFMNKYVGIGELEGDSSQIYDFTNIGRKFPLVNTVEDGINEMKKRVPKLFVKDRLFVKDKLFVKDRLFLYSDKMFNGVFYLMKMYVKEYSTDQVPISITRNHLTEQDFIAYSGVALFLNEYDLKTWLKSLDKFPNILDKIDLKLATKTDPYMYVAPDEHIYLVQNVVEGSIQKALNVCDYWDKYKINPGFKTEDYDEVAKYVVYDISQANTIVLAENNAGDSTEFYSILRYNSFSHAAMLRLL